MLLLKLRCENVVKMNRKDVYQMKKQ